MVLPVRLITSDGLLRSLEANAKLRTQGQSGAIPRVMARKPSLLGWQQAAERSRQFLGVAASQFPPNHRQRSPLASTIANFPPPHFTSRSIPLPENHETCFQPGFGCADLVLAPTRTG